MLAMCLQSEQHPKIQLMKTRLPRLFAILVLSALVGSSALAAQKKVLVVTTTTGFRHSSIETAEKVIAELGEKSGAFTVDYVQQPAHQPNAPKKLKDDAPAEEGDKFKTEEAK